MDHGGRPAHDVNPLGGAEGGHVVARIIQPPHAVKVAFTGGAAQVRGSGNPEKGLGKTARGEDDEVVQVGNAELFQGFGADYSGRARRLQQTLVEPEHGIRLVRRNLSARPLAAITRISSAAGSTAVSAAQARTPRTASASSANSGKRFVVIISP